MICILLLLLLLLLLLFLLFFFLHVPWLRGFILLCFLFLSKITIQRFHIRS